MNESHVIRKERCPSCANLGKDLSHDNLAVYSDGHSWCYSCGYFTVGLLDRFCRGSQVTRKVDEQKHSIFLPEDSDVNYPNIALDWTEQYELTRTDLLNHNVLWSNTSSRLIFPVYDSNMDLLAYQGRYFGPVSSGKPYPKWYGKGNLKGTFNILGRSSSTLVLTEDIVSAIKVSKFCMAMPLYGCVVGAIRFKRLRMLIAPSVEVKIWLDPDKRKESLQEARIGNMCGVKTSVILSDKDPKEHTFQEIKEILK